MDVALEADGADAALDVSEVSRVVHLALDGLFVVAERTVEDGVDRGALLLHDASLRLALAHGGEGSGGGGGDGGSDGEGGGTRTIGQAKVRRVLTRMGG